MRVSVIGLGLLTLLSSASCQSNPAVGGGDGGPALDGGPGGGDGGMNTAGPQSVLQRGNDFYRRATYVQPGLVATAVTAMAPDTTFNTNATFPANGNTQNQGTASVLYIEKGPPQAGCPPAATGCLGSARAANDGLFFAFPALGSNPNVVALDETSGLPVWTAHVTTGGDGIRGTPVIDADARRLFVVTGNNPHLVTRCRSTTAPKSPPAAGP